MTLTYNEFLESLKLQFPEAEWSEPLKAMWFDVKGEWEASHNIAQDLHTTNGSWIHAYLHRKEGDKFNAGYWYRMADKKFPTISLEDEQRRLVEYFLKE